MPYILAMILGTGIDIVLVSRIRALRERWGETRLRRIFTPAELSYCLGLEDMVPSLAARFAAKEALFKALGTGVGRAGRWVDVEVVRDGRGCPTVRLHGSAARTAERAGVRGVHLSLSHTAEIAIASVVLEDVPGPDSLNGEDGPAA